MFPVGDSVSRRRFPLVTVSIIVANLGVWLFVQVPHLERSVVDLGFIPCEARNDCTDFGVQYPLDVVTAMFAHGGWLHIAANMLFLWIFGDNVEDVMGRLRFAVFYLLAGVAAMALQTAVTLAVGTPDEAAIPNVGASGAIAGVLGAYFVLYPWSRVLAVVPFFFFLVPIEVPGFVFLFVWFVFQLWQGGFSLLAPGTGGGVAFFAHIGGFLFGMLAVRVFVPARRAPVARLWQ